MSSKQHALPVGAIIDRYQVVEVLGEGGFGITYKARDPKLAVDVAIKEFLPLEMAGREGATTTVIAHASRAEEYRWGLERFLEEGRTLARFKHPNVVRVSNFLEANGTAYLVMDFEQGQSLSDWLKVNPGQIPQEQLKSWFVSVLRGLIEVHKEGFLHRDIKPGNIYLREVGEPLLIDFGAARQAIGEHSRSVTGIVSAGYAPNEQYGSDAKKQGPWTDLYSTGATLYRCISGKDPVDAPTRQSALVEGDPDPLTPAVELGQGHYSQPFLQLIDELLVLPVKQRPQSAELVLAALQAGTALAPQEPRSTMVTQLVPPGLQASASAPVPAPKPATDTPSPAGNTWKIMAGLAIVGLLVAVGYLLTQKEGTPSPAVTANPAAVAVTPTPETSAAVAPPPVATTPTPAATPAPMPATVTDASVDATPASAEPAPARESEPSPTGQLTLNLTPANARVVLPDIGPRYEPAMTLEPGSYRVKVSAPGYERWEGPVEVARGDNVHDISLRPLPKRQVGDVFRDRLQSGGQGPSMIVLPAGDFRMGDLSGEGDEGERPVHGVTISRPFAMGRYEVKVDEFRRFVRDTGYRTDAEKNAGGEQGCYTREFQGRDKWGWTTGRYWDSLEYTVEEGQPVTCVSWNDAQAYVGWIKQQTGRAYRLPSESEWEYAARAGSTSKYHFGNDPDQLCRYGNVGDTTELPNGNVWTKKENCSDGAVYPTRVGNYRANTFGLYDMHGNVWEWVQDCYHDGYAGAPQDGSAWTVSCRTDDSGTSYRVLRGGSWNAGPGYLRSADRSWAPPSNRYNNNGFRLVQDLDS